MSWNGHTSPRTEEVVARSKERAAAGRTARKAVKGDVERKDWPAARPGRCDWCGSAIARGRRFCPGPGCAAAHRDTAKERGALIYELADRMRAWRGRKGATAGLWTELCRRVDMFIAEDKAALAALEDECSSRHRP